MSLLYLSSLNINFAGVITDGPDLSIITQGSVRLSCQITCSENSWVTWVVNGKPIQLFPQVGSSVSNDYNVKCSPNGVNNDTILSRSYLEHLEVATYFEIAKVPLGVQCVSVHHCSRDTGSCHDSVCYSNVTLLGMSNGRKCYCIFIHAYIFSAELKVLYSRT